MFLFVAGVIGLGMFGFHPQVVHGQTAITSASTIIAPTFQEITLLPDDTSQTGQIQVTNQNDQPQSFDLFAIDVDQLDSQGNVSFSDKPLATTTSPRSAYVTISTETIELLPYQTTTIQFTVTNAQTMPPGGNYVVLVLRAQPPANQTGANPSVLPAISTFVLIRKLGGELYNLSLTQVSTTGRFFWSNLPNTMDLVFENQGNIHTTPRGHITSVDLFGRTVLEGTINDSSQFVYPRTQRTISNQLRQIRPAWPIMLYTTTVTGRSDPGESVFSQQLITLFISPLFAFTVIGVSLAMTLATIKVLRRKKTSRVKPTS